MAAGKGGEDQIAAIGVARMDGQLVAIFNNFAHFRDVAEIQHRIDTAGDHVHAQGYDIDIAGPLPIAKQGAFDAVSTCHLGKFRCDHARSPVIMGMNRQDQTVPPGEMAMHPFNGIRIDIGRGNFHRRGQVQDTGLLGRWFPDIHHGFANFQRVIQFRLGIAFRGIFEPPVGAWIFLCMFTHHFGAIQRDLFHPGAVLLENDATLNGGG